MKKSYTTAPLPFQGQKRNFLPQFIEKIKEYAPDATFVDVFGGSGLLSRAVKDTLPNAKVVYNDFDDYTIRLKNIPTTNILLVKIRELLMFLPENTRLPVCVKEKILELIKNAIEDGFYIDYVTISSSICFGGRYINNFQELQKTELYNKCIKKDYNNPDGYLDGLEIITEDWKAVFEEYKNTQNVVFILDPPYLTTSVESYTGTYWGLITHLNLLATFDKHNYIMFTSEKSQIVEMIEHFAKRFNYEQKLIITLRNGLNCASGASSKGKKPNMYQDIMLNQFAR